MQEPNSNQEQYKPIPRWETAILILSFVAIWVWWLVRQNAYKTQSDFPIAWNAILLVTIGLLVWVFVRRLKRTLAAMKSIQPGQSNSRGRI
jgi:cytochrome bd-type quinol oxidase subunit 2